jgi:O-methyltransferase
MLLRRLVRKAKRRFDSAQLSSTARLVQAERLTYLPPRRLLTLERSLREVRRGVDGDLVEAGVALGGSAILLASNLNGRRQFHGYDLFGMIPPPSERDAEHAHRRYEEIESGRSRGIGNDVYYGYLDDLYERVVASFATHGVAVDNERVFLHRGPFEETLRPDRPVALAHVDCDWYDPVALCLDRIWPRLSEGGLVVIDDYADLDGCRRAVDAFLDDHKDGRLIQTAPNAVIRRVARR